MPPNSASSQQLIVDDHDEFGEDIHGHDLAEHELKFRPLEIYKDLRNLDWSKVVWKQVGMFIVLHVYAAYGIYLTLTGQVCWQTLCLATFLYTVSGLGITMGAHRLWAHKSYKAAWTTRAILVFLQTMAFQNSVFEWSRDHRAHHKFTETNGDPHNVKRGFFFAHMGWLMYRKHPDVIKGGKSLDVSDLLADSLVAFQHKYYLPLVALVCFIIPTAIPVYFWNENWLTALMVAGFMRYTFLLHSTWCVNSLAHYVGTRPYDKTIYASENPLVAFLTVGEGWHNFHHVFPYDYRAAEFGGISNITASIIEFCSKIGLTYDLKAASDNLIEKRILRTGDPSLRSQMKKD
ncbi:Fatty acid desaturase domain [Trinorchestia longiramus]|nr:Fatty acid desaturase domain [Trinorchestia longiramus]